MHPPIDLESLPPPARKVLDPAAPAPLRAMAAKGVVPGLKPEHLVAVIAALTVSSDNTAAQTARATLADLPGPILAGALGADLDPGVIDALAPLYVSREDVIEKLLAMPRITVETVEIMAATGTERVTEHIATNETRLLQNPRLIEKLYMNKRTRMSTADRILELAVRNKIELHGIPAFKEAAAAIEGELIAEPAEEATPDDVAFMTTDEIAAALDLDPTAEDTHVRTDEGEEVVEKKVLPLHAMLASLSISGKIRRAMLGSAAERMLLVRDHNKLVASAAIRSPQVQEPEVVRISASRSTHDDVLRYISTNGEWLKNHQIKYNLVSNPRTPFAFSARLIMHMRDHELKNLEKSREVTAAVRQAAKQQLQRKGKGGGLRSPDGDGVDAHAGQGDHGRNACAGEVERAVRADAAGGGDERAADQRQQTGCEGHDPRHPRGLFTGEQRGDPPFGFVGRLVAREQRPWAFAGEAGHGDVGRAHLGLVRRQDPRRLDRRRPNRPPRRERRLAIAGRLGGARQVHQAPVRSGHVRRARHVPARGLAGRIDGGHRVLPPNRGVGVRETSLAQHHRARRHQPQGDRHRGHHAENGADVHRKSRRLKITLESASKRVAQNTV